MVFAVHTITSRRWNEEVSGSNWTKRWWSQWKIELASNWIKTDIVANVVSGNAGEPTSEGFGRSTDRNGTIPKSILVIHYGYASLSLVAL